MIDFDFFVFEKWEIFLTQKSKNLFRKSRDYLLRKNYNCSILKSSDFLIIDKALLFVGGEGYFLEIFHNSSKYLF